MTQVIATKLPFCPTAAEEVTDSLPVLLALGKASRVAVPGLDEG